MSSLKFKGIDFVEFYYGVMPEKGGDLSNVTMKAVDSAVSMDVVTNSTAMQQWALGKEYYTKNVINNLTATLILRALTDEMLKDVLGHKDAAEGGIMQGTNANGNYVSVAGKGLTGTGKPFYVFIYNGKFAEPNTTLSSKTEAGETLTDLTLTGTFSGINDVYKWVVFEEDLTADQKKAFDEKWGKKLMIPTVKA